MIHTSVLLHSSIDGLDIHPGDIYLDGTLGSAGHANYALEKAGGDLTVIGLDRDMDALARSREILGTDKKIILKQSSYADLDKVLDELHIPQVNRIMLDLGISSDQFETSGRGFTFQKDEPLLMTMAKHPAEDDLTARYILNHWEESTLADIIYGYGEERYARKIASAIVAYRQKKSIDTTFELVDIVKSAVPGMYRRGRLHPSTRTFQALRITVNDELNTLKQGLEKGFTRLAPKGRMAVISFHSIEDRIVKNMLREAVQAGLGSLAPKKPVVPSRSEVVANRRARRPTPR